MGSSTWCLSRNRLIVDNTLERGATSSCSVARLAVPRSAVRVDRAPGLWRRRSGGTIAGSGHPENSTSYAPSAPLGSARILPWYQFEPSNFCASTHSPSWYDIARKRD